MLGKLLVKFVFKASLPIVAVAGVLSYGLYLKGGDPKTLWSTVASNTMQSIRNSGANTVQGAQALASNAGIGSSSSESTTVYTWVDSSGTTHYGSNPPTGVVAKAMSVKSSAPSAPYTNTANSEPTLAAALPGQTQNLAGMAGVKLPMNIHAEELGMTREELLEMMSR